MLVPPPLPWLIETLPTAVEPFIAVSRALPWVIVRLPANPARTGLPCVPDVVAGYQGRIGHQIASDILLADGDVARDGRAVALAESPLPPP